MLRHLLCRPRLPRGSRVQRAGGRRQAIPIEGSEFIEPCDTLLIAIGQQTVNDFIDVRVETDRGGNVRVAENGMTSINGLFAAGDYVNGASTAIEATGHSRKIATKIDAWLVGRERRQQRVRIEPVDRPLRERAWDFIPRQTMPTIPLGQRRKTPNGEVQCGMNADQAGEERKGHHGDEHHLAFVGELRDVEHRASHPN